ncbi:uncharacterized protein LOC144610525 [Rhinoraja longicauda]
MDMKAEAQRVMAVALGKMYSSRLQRGGARLHRSLLLSLVLRGAQDVYLGLRAARELGQEEEEEEEEEPAAPGMEAVEESEALGKEEEAESPAQGRGIELMDCSAQPDSPVGCPVQRIDPAGCVESPQCIQAAKCIDLAECGESQQCIQAAKCIDLAECGESQQCIQAAGRVTSPQCIDSAAGGESLQCIQAAQRVTSPQCIDSLQCIQAAECADSLQCIQAAECADSLQCIQAAPCIGSPQCIESGEVSPPCAQSAESGQADAPVRCRRSANQHHVPRADRGKKRRKGSPQPEGLPSKRARLEEEEVEAAVVVVEEEGESAHVQAASLGSGLQVKVKESQGQMWRDRVLGELSLWVRPIVAY